MILLVPCREYHGPLLTLCFAMDIPNDKTIKDMNYEAHYTAS